MQAQFYINAELLVNALSRNRTPLRSKPIADPLAGNSFVVNASSEFFPHSAGRFNGDKLLDDRF